MNSVSIPVDLLEDPRVLSLPSDRVTLLYLWCWSHSAKFMTDGFIESNVAIRAAGLYDLMNEDFNTLEESGLWEVHYINGERKGYLITDYLNHNPSREKVANQRAKTRERVQKHRKNKQEAG